MAKDSTEELDLEYTRAKRKEFVDMMTKNGPPSDIREASIMLQALDGIDRAALGKLKIKSDEGIGSAQAAAAAMLASLFNDPRTKTIGRVDGVDRIPPELILDTDSIVIIEGELDIVPKQDSYDTYSARAA